ncbi:hypothetical protein NLS1_07970 [Nocardioides sp. LS1]|nr:hypothetical protein NLS1_07970 [Nocardioides sp. LS1]
MAFDALALASCTGAHEDAFTAAESRPLPKSPKLLMVSDPTIEPAQVWVPDTRGPAEQDVDPYAWVKASEAALAEPGSLARVDTVQPDRVVPVASHAVSRATTAATTRARNGLGSRT